MLAAQVAVILPHLPRLHWVIIGAAVACGGWRIMVYRGRWSFPPRWVKAVLVIGGMIGVPVAYGTVLGLEPAVALLIVAFFFKLLEMQQRRDAFLVVFLAYFVAATEFLFVQTIPMALYMFTVIVMITASLIGLNQSAWHVMPLHTARRAGLMLAQAAPLQSAVGRTGVTDRLEVGDIASLTQSDELAFRVVFDGEVPGNHELYWRGLALSRYDARENAWIQEDPVVYGRRPIEFGNRMDAPWDALIERRGRPVSYSVIMEPTQQNFVFALATPVPESRGIGLVRDYRLYSVEPIVKRLRYSATSWLDHRIERDLAPEWRYRMTLLPEGSNPRTLAMAQAMRARVDSDKAYIREIAALFQRQFIYTLKPGLLGDAPYDEFLLDSQRGFCEHFAGAFVYLMRGVGVPARVVLGYQGGEYNPRGNYVAVHQFDAHAWAEVWFPGEGWVRYDPTSWVAPERIQLGLEAAIGDEDTFLEDSPLSWLRYRQTLWLTELRLQLSAISHYWDTWVIGYTPSVQMQFLRKLIPDLSYTMLGGLLLGAFFLVLGVIGATLLLKRSTAIVSPADREYRRFCQALARLGITRAAGEGPVDFAARVADARPDLATPVTAVTSAYIAVNYAGDDAFPALADAVKAFRLRAIAS